MLEKETPIVVITQSQWANIAQYSVGLPCIVLFTYTTIKCSQADWNFLFYISLLALLSCIGFISYYFLLLKYTKYKITSQRIEKTEGILSRTTTNLELYRVKDLRLKRSLLQRMVKIGTIELSTSDQSDHRFHLNGITNYEHIYSTLRHHVESTRIARGVREIDQNDHIVDDH